METTGSTRSRGVLGNVLLRAAVVLLIAAFGVLLAAACGGGEDGDEAPPGGEATATEEPEEPEADSGDETTGGVELCSLVTKEEAEAVLGEPVDEPETGAATCVYIASAIDSLGSVAVGHFEYPGEELAASSFDSSKETGGEIEPVSGIGDDAYWQAGIDGLSVLVGKHYLLISVTLKSQDDAAALEASKELAQQVIDRLP